MEKQAVDRQHECQRGIAMALADFAGHQFSPWPTSPATNFLPGRLRRPPIFSLAGSDTGPHALRGRTPAGAISFARRDPGHVARRIKARHGE
jgi:hypothetical protein